ncbi:MAG: DUF1573 domain-containing protein [Candidatus Omnitrophica bacterium]|nr:DUF1573 domain-containing protein [Candidatus Omnitrophota bacterium]
MLHLTSGRLRLSVLFLTSILTFCFFSPLVCRPTENLQESVQSKIWDFGRVKETKILKHNFIFKNETGKILHIVNVSTSCGCMVSKVNKTTLLPRETAVIAVEFNPASYSGKITQYVYLHTDNIKNLLIEFALRAEVMS